MLGRLGSPPPRATWIRYCGQFDGSWLGNDVPVTGIAKADLPLVTSDRLREVSIVGWIFANK